MEGTTQGITTNVDGDYTLTNVPANATLVVSYLGYKTEKIPVGNKTRIDVTLREDTAEIEGVMVVALSLIHILLRRDDHLHQPRPGR